MPERILAPAAVATLLCLTTTAVMAQSPTGTMDAEQGWSSIARCAQEDTERGRHACVDRVLRDAGLLTNEMRAKQQRRAFGLDDKSARATPPVPKAATPPSAANPAAPASTTPSATTPPAGAQAPAASTAPAPASAASPTPSETPDRLEVELTKVQKAANGRLFVTTSDGAVWLQTESVTMPIPPVAGDRMSIRKGSLGGYVCSVASTRLTYRCIRNR